MRALVLGLLGLVMLCAVTVHADNREEAGREFAAGQAADEAKDYKNAIDHYWRAYELAPHHFALYNIAVAYEHLGQLREAAKNYARYLDEAPSSLTKERREVEKIMVGIKARPAKVTVKSTPPGARVLIDGQAAGVAPVVRLVRGGQHRIRIEMDGERSERDVLIEYAEPQTIELSLDVKRPAPTTSEPIAPPPTETPTIAPIAPPSATTGILIVRGGPAGAFVSVDEVVVGRVPGQFNVEPGAHTVRVTSTGYTTVVLEATTTTGQATPLDVTLEADPTTPTTIRAQYLLGVALGADVSGNGGALLADFGVRITMLDLAVRVGKVAGITAVDFALRWAFLRKRITPFIGLGFGYGTGKDEMGVSTSATYGYQFTGGLRYDIARGQTATMSLVAEGGLRIYPTLDTGSKDMSKFSVPVMLAAQVTYGQAR